jgi:hypothetical protein
MKRYEVDTEDGEGIEDTYNDLMLDVDTNNEILIVLDLPLMLSFLNDGAFSE